MGGSSRFSEAVQYWNEHAPALIKKYMDFGAESEHIARRIKDNNEANSLTGKFHRLKDSWQHAMGKPTLLDTYHSCKAAQLETGRLLNNLANQTVLQLAEDHGEKRNTYLDELKRQSEMAELERFYEDGLKWIVDIHRQTLNVQGVFNRFVPLGDVSAARIDKGHMIKAHQTIGEDGEAYRYLAHDIRELTDYIYDGLEEQGVSSYVANTLKDELSVLCNILPSSKGLNDLDVKKTRLVSFEDALLQPANKLLSLHKGAKAEMQRIRGNLYVAACDVLSEAQVPEDSIFSSEIRFFMQPGLMDDAGNKPGPKSAMQIKA